MISLNLRGGTSGEPAGVRKAVSTAIGNRSPLPLDGPAPDTQEIASRIADIFAGRYFVVRLIGIGGMASVYLARHQIHDGLFAIKVLHPALAKDADLAGCFHREGLIGARLAGHPNIAPVLDMGQHDGLHYLVMPYIAGEDLDHLLGRVGRFSFHDALVAAIQINEAVLYLWKKGILHCDLTPGNLRLNEFGQLVLMDFGLARLVSQARQAAIGQSMSNSRRSAASHVGTPRYMSPERTLGQPADIRSDLYALGAILYEMVTGEAALHASVEAESQIDSQTIVNQEQIESKHLFHAQQLIHVNLDQQPGVVALLESLLARSPADRISDPVALRQALRALVAFPPALTICPKLQNQRETQSRRRRLFRT